MVSQSSYHYGSSLDASKSRSLRMRWPHLRQKLSPRIWQKSTPINNTSSTTVDSSDISLKNGIPAVAAGDLNYPSVEWGEGRQATPTFSKLFSKLVLQPASPNNGHYKTQGTTSHQTRSKRPDKAGQRRKSASKGARDAGSGSGSGGGGKGGKGRGGGNGPPPPDGWRFPPLGDARPPKCLGCPFYMTEPLRYHECSSLRLQRPSDVSQHIKRTHLLQEIGLGFLRDTESIDRTEGSEAGTYTNANDITLYHATCRIEFHGPTAEENRQDHCRNLECVEAGIEDTGVMLPAEYDILTGARDAVSGSVAKWYAMWKVCYPPVRRVGYPPATTTILTRFRTVPASPYVSYLGGDETDRELQQIVQDQQRQRDLDIRQASQPVSTSSHLPSTGLDPWGFFAQETPGLQHASPFHSSSLTLPLQQHELLTGQPSNRTATSLGSLLQQSQMPYRTPISSSTPSTLPLQPPMVQLPYQDPHLGFPSEASDPASQQAMNWWSNPANWNRDYYGGSQ
ncbi:hypothetical protein FNYG_01415 [Fusarium nygamai]|uniref:Uncharacterized protein n=1 Tax=Gibberella nygamai TaxID=42673 RepID=A0A2K0WSH8_GIBNY|nr:hypothetical protein FNYG_01415 [Fusarium nygamai]